MAINEISPIEQQPLLPLPAQLVVKLAVVSEGILLFLALVWIHLRSIPIPLSFSLDALSYTLLTVALMLGVNNLSTKHSSPEKFSLFYTFEYEVLHPLCYNLQIRHVFIVALLSGVCEEIFFRGVLDFELSSLFGLPGILLSAFIFAFVHFIGAVKKYWPLIFLYTAFGLIFSYLLAISGTLLSCMLCHAIYNSIALVIFRTRAHAQRCTELQNGESQNGESQSEV